MITFTEKLAEINQAVLETQTVVQASAIANKRTLLEATKNIRAQIEMKQSTDVLITEAKKEGLKLVYDSNTDLVTTVNENAPLKKSQCVYDGAFNGCGTTLNMIGQQKKINDAAGLLDVNQPAQVSAQNNVLKLNGPVKSQSAKKSASPAKKSASPAKKSASPAKQKISFTS